MLNELIEYEISSLLTLFFFLNFVKIFTLIILRRVEMAKGWQYCKFYQRQRIKLASVFCTALCTWIQIFSLGLIK